MWLCQVWPYTPWKAPIPIANSEFFWRSHFHLLWILCERLCDGGNISNVMIMRHKHCTAYSEIRRDDSMRSFQNTLLFPPLCSDCNTRSSKRKYTQGVENIITDGRSTIASVSLLSPYGNGLCSHTQSHSDDLIQWSDLIRFAASSWKFPELFRFVTAAEYIDRAISWTGLKIRG